MRGVDRPNRKRTDTGARGIMMIPVYILALVIPAAFLFGFFVCALLSVDKVGGRKNK